MGQLLPPLPARVLLRATTPGPAGRGGGAGCGLGAVGAGWGHPRHSALGEKGAMGCARTRPRALNHSRSLFGLFTHFLFCIPRHSPALQLPGDFSHRRANKTISHAGQQLSGLTPQHLSTTSPRPSPSPSSSSLACGHPSSQQGNPHSQPQPWATSPKPRDAGPVPCPGPRQGGGMEQEPKGPKRPQRAA